MDEFNPLYGTANLLDEVDSELYPMLPTYFLRQTNIRHYKQ